ncbi:MAG TPA: diguanylate cyclase, partial [Nitrospiria bacterium]
VIMDPPRLTFIFLALYLPFVALLSRRLARLSAPLPIYKQALLHAVQAIPFEAPPFRMPHPSPASFPTETIVMGTSPPEAPAEKIELTSSRSENITDLAERMKNENRGAVPAMDPEKLKEILDQFSSLIQITLASYDPEGSLLNEASRENPICGTVQQTERGRKHCKSYCGRSIGLALQSGETPFFKCDMNLHIFAIPIIINHQNRLVIQGGKIYHSPQEFTDCRPAAALLGLSDEALEGLRPSPRILDPLKLGEAARFLETVLPPLLSFSLAQKTIDSKFSRLISLFSLLSELRNDPSQLVDALLSALGVLFNISTACVLQRDPKQAVLSAVGVFGRRSDQVRTFKTEDTNPVIQSIFRQRGPLALHDTRDILTAGFPPEFHSVHLFPLLYKDQNVHGVLCIFDTALDEQDIRMIAAFCQEISLIQENTELHSERSHLAQDVSVLREIAKTVGSALDSNELFSIILEKSTQFLQAEQGSLMLLDDERNELTIKAMKGLNQKVVELLRIKPGTGIAGQVIVSGTPLVVADMAIDKRVTQKGRPRYKTRSFISIPLKLDNRTIGVLNVADKITGEIFTEEDLHLLISIGAYASVAIERSKYYHKTEELKRISITDSLTGLLNRRYFQERMAEEVERSRRHHLPLSLIMIDIDDFKAVNDTLGHPTGDEVLKISSRCIRNCIRTIDVAARYGGEEFTVILPQTNKEDAHTIAERICSEIHHMELPFTKSDQRLTLSVSIGLATYPEDAENLEELIRNVDIALYAAKSQGKNRVVVFRP